MVIAKNNAQQEKNFIRVLLKLWKGLWHGLYEIVLLFSSAYFFTFAVIYIIIANDLQRSILVLVVSILLVLFSLVAFSKFSWEWPLVWLKRVGAMVTTILFLGTFFYPDLQIVRVFSTHVKNLDMLFTEITGAVLVELISWIILISWPVCAFIAIDFVSKKIKKGLPDDSREGRSARRVGIILGTIALIVWMFLFGYFDSEIERPWEKMTVFKYLAGTSVVAINALHVINVLLKHDHTFPYKPLIK